MLGDPAIGETAAGMGMYWRIEKRIRELEAAVGFGSRRDRSALCGAAGIAGLQVRKETILDDVYHSDASSAAGKSGGVRCAGKSLGSSGPGNAPRVSQKGAHLERQLSTAATGALVVAEENPMRFELISHKLIRLVVPFALVAALAASWFLPGPFYRAAFWTQLGFYGLSVLGWTRWDLGPVSRLSDAAYTFVALNTAALVAFANLVTGRKTIWMQPVLQREMKA